MGDSDILLFVIWMTKFVIYIEREIIKNNWYAAAQAQAWELCALMCFLFTRKHFYFSQLFKQCVVSTNHKPPPQPPPLPPPVNHMA